MASTPADQGIAAARQDAQERRDAAALAHGKATIRFLTDALQGIEQAFQDGEASDTINGVIGSIFDTPEQLRNIACDVESLVRHFRRNQA